MKLIREIKNKTNWFDKSKAKKELNWIPKIGLEDTLKEMMFERRLGR